MAKVSFLGEKRLEKEHTSPSPEVRVPTWDFENTSLEGKTLENQFFRTYFAGLSLLFPEGERFFIRAVKAHADKVSDPKLKEDIKAFIGQEVQHGKLHERLNRVSFGKRYDIEPFLEQWTGLAFGRLEKFADRFLPDTIPVSITAAAEHFTAVWAAYALRTDLFQSIPDDQIRDLVSWHAIEEIEHKHVAFDVMRNADDSYLTRAAGMVLAGPIIGLLSIWGGINLALQEEHVDWIQYGKDFTKNLTEKDGMLRVYVEAFFEYFQPGFHPAQHDGDYELAREFANMLKNKMESAKSISS